MKFEKIKFDFIGNFVRDMKSYIEKNKKAILKSLFKSDDYNGTNYYFLGKSTVNIPLVLRGCSFVHYFDEHYDVMYARKYFRIYRTGRWYIGIAFRKDQENLIKKMIDIKKFAQVFLNIDEGYWEYEFPLKIFKEKQRIEIINKFYNDCGIKDIPDFVNKYLVEEYSKKGVLIK